jgi:tripartite-type tricarboxylate transporter receptor subunit TctC
MPNSLCSRRALLALAGVSLGVTALGVRAQNPTPLRVILPVGAGSGADTIVRSAQAALARGLGGQPVVMENLPGAGGITGTQALVKASPDGNTIAFISNNHAVNPSVFKKLPYDSLADITPISIVGGSPFVLVAHPRLAARNARELQALMKARPGDLNYASSGNGTIFHLAAEVFLEAAGTTARHIPYKGTGQMVVDLLSGQVDFGVIAVGTAQAHLKSGALRALGIMGRERVASLPDLPTLAEQGFAGVDVAGWVAAIAPRGLPAAQLRRLHDGIAMAFADPEVRAGFARRDEYTVLNSPEAAAQFLRSEQERFARLARKANVTLE